MTDKQINRWLRRQFSPIGWVLIGYFLVMNVLVWLGMFAEELKLLMQAAAAGDFSGELDWDVIYGNGWGYVFTTLIFLVLLHAWKGTDYWKSELFRREKPMGPGVFFGLISFCITAQMVNSLWITGLELVMNLFGMSVYPLLSYVTGEADTFSMFLYGSLLAPVAEELLFRGYVLRTLRPFGKRFAILGSAILFGLFHGNLLQTPYAFLMGLLLGYAAVEYSVYCSIALHVFNNLVLADLLTRLTANLSDFWYGVVDLTIFGSFTMAACILMVRKRREIAAYICSEWIDRRCLKCLFTNAGVLVLTILAVYNMLSLFFMQ